jgi:hypothetical protein
MTITVNKHKHHRTDLSRLDISSKNYQIHICKSLSTLSTIQNLEVGSYFFTLKNLKKKPSKKSFGVEFLDFSLVRTNDLMAIMHGMGQSKLLQKKIFHT